MRVALVYTKNAGTEEDAIFPALDSNANIVFKDEDGEVSAYTADVVKCLDIVQGGGTEVRFALNGGGDKCWEVFVTDDRIAVRNTYTQGLFGKAKVKPGKVSVGHLHFKSIIYLSTFFSATGSPVLMCECYRKDNTRSTITIESSDFETMKNLSKELYLRLDKWIQDNGHKLVINEDSNDKERFLDEKWREFKDKMWDTETHKEVAALVSCDTVDLVADNLF